MKSKYMVKSDVLKITVVIEVNQNNSENRIIEGITIHIPNNITEDNKKDIDAIIKRKIKIETKFKELSPFHRLVYLYTTGIKFDVLETHKKTTIIPKEKKSPTKPIMSYSINKMVILKNKVIFETGNEIYKIENGSLNSIVKKEEIESIKYMLK